MIYPIKVIRKISVQISYESNRNFFLSLQFLGRDWNVSAGVGGVQLDGGGGRGGADSDSDRSGEEGELGTPG